MDEGQGRKKFGPKLDATTSTLPGPLSPGPPGPGPGYDVPPEPPSRRPCLFPNGLRQIFVAIISQTLGPLPTGA